MSINKALLLAAISAITILPSCSNKEVQQNCKCCGGFTGGCWDEVMQANSNSELKAKCVAKAPTGADYTCDLD